MLGPLARFVKSKQSAIWAPQALIGEPGPPHYSDVVLEPETSDLSVRRSADWAIGMNRAEALLVMNPGTTA